MVYLDFNATTPLDPRVREVLLDAVDRFAGNPSSAQHASGRRAAEALDGAREATAELLGVSRREVAFTSGATEALTLAILGIAAGLPVDRRRLLVSTTEHKAALAAADLAGRYFGVKAVRIPVEPSGLPDLGAWEEELDRTVGLVVVMLANNETGVVNPIREISSLSHSVGAIVLSDVTQGIGKLSVDLPDLGVDVAALSGHKFYGPRGTGALIATRDVQRGMVGFMPGGGQERGIRGGTQNVPSLVAMGVAAGLAGKEGLADAERLSLLAELFRDRLQQALPGSVFVAEGTPRLESTICVRFPGADSEDVLAGLRETEVSAGSACSSGNPEPSHVLQAMGLSGREARECIRISLGRPTTWDECMAAISDLEQSVSRVRAREGSR